MLGHLLACASPHLSESLPPLCPLPTVKPSKPRCSTEGPTQEGKDIVLRCLSNEGTNPLQYSWEKTSDNKLLPASAVLGKAPPTLTNMAASSPPLPHWVRVSHHVVSGLAADPVGGTVNVRNASASASGTYRCTASNRVGAEECTLYLNVTPRE